MTSGLRLRWPVALPVAVFGVAAALQVALSTVPGLGDPPAQLALALCALAVPVALGALLGVRVPDRQVGPALSWVGAAPAAVFAVELWGQSSRTARPWPAAGILYPVQLGAWVWNLAGFTALCLVFPTGMLPGRRWRAVAWSTVAVGLSVHAVASVQRSGDTTARLPAPLVAGVVVLAGCGCLAALGAAVVSLVVRYRRGDEVTRLQLRWLVLAAGTVPVLLAAGWAMQSFGAPVGVAYVGFLLAMLLAVPAAVAVAVLRHDLFDVDRLLGASLAWLLTSLVSAAAFAAVVVAAAGLGADTRLGVTGAAFVTALALVPVHRWFGVAVGRVVDRDRYVVTARVRQFVRAVRDGSAEPEQTEEVLRALLADPALRLLLRVPGSGTGDGYVDLTGRPAAPSGEDSQIPLRSGRAEVGLLVLGTSSARRLRRAREVAREARLPIEVSRLRLELRTALHDVRSSRERLVRATAEERRRLERDLHDGAQQQIIAVGMRLRSLQRRLDPGDPAHRELDTAVAALQATVAELRRLAHGLRPGRLDDGLPEALRALVAHSPVPVELSVADVAVSDVVRTTVYFVVAEAYANALKHAESGTVTIRVEPRGDTLLVEVSDDGVGGAGTNLVAVRDRVASIGGTVRVNSPPGAGTTVTVEVPDAHRRGR